MPPDRRLPMMGGPEMPVLSVGLTKQQIEASPEALDLSMPPDRRLPMMGGPEMQVLSVGLTKQQIEASPEASDDEPLSQQMQEGLYQHYGWDPYWGDTYFGPDAIDPLSKPIRAETGTRPASATESLGAGGDPHLRSVVEVKGYHVHATDGDIGHVENFLADDANWDIRYLVVATRNWLPGRACPARPLRRQGHRLGRTPHRRQRHARTSKIESGLGPDRARRPDRPATIPPPFRLAGIRLVEASISPHPAPLPSQGCPGKFEG